MKAQVIYKNKETPDTISIRYEPAEPMKTKAGQFIMLKLEVEQEGKKKILNRSYSMSSTPADPYLETAVKLEGIGSNRIHTMNPGDEIEIEGPFGHFTFEKDQADDIVLIGAGSGITPLMGILRHINQENIPTQATLFYSNKTPEDIVYRKELEQIGKENKNINCHFTITRSDEPRSAGWKGITGRITIETIKDKIKDIKKPLFYLCGPAQFVEDLKIALLQAGVPKEHIKQERYGTEY